MDENEEILEEETLEEESYDEPYEEPYTKVNPQSQQKKETKSATEKAADTVNTAGNVTKGVGNAGKAAGSAMKGAGKGGQLAGKGMQTAGKGLQSAGKGISSASSAAGSALSAIPYIGAPLGSVVSGAGKLAGGGVSALGKGTELAGKGVDKTSKGLEKAGDKTKQASDKLSKTGDKIKKEAADMKKNALSSPGKTSSSVFKGNDVTPPNQIKKVLKHWKLYFFLTIGIIFMIIMVFYFIMSPVIDSLDKFAEFLNGTVKTAEKAGNLYSGLGYKTTEEAFYEEMEYLYNKSAGELNLPLVMSALYYSETRNDYTTDYSQLDDSDNSKQIFKDIVSQYNKNNQYTQGMILRLRMLNSGMLEGSNQGERITLDEFKRRYGEILTSDLENTKDALIGMLMSANPLQNSIDLFKSAFNFVFGPTFITAGDSVYTALSRQLETYSMGLKSISSMEYGVDENGQEQIYLTVYSKRYDEEKFKGYLSSFYIKKMPEFKPYLKGLEGLSLDREIDNIINEIYDHASWYTSVYGQTEKPAESYNPACSGGIPEDLVSELRVPVDIPANRQVSFSEPYPYGIRNGVMHNGVDINKETTGNNEGDNVYAIASGKVISSEPNNSCNTNSDPNCTSSYGAWVRIKHSIMVDGNKYEFISVYMHLKENSGQPKVGDKVQKGDIIGKIGNTGDSKEPHLHFEYRSDDGSDNGVSVDPINLFVACNSSVLTGDSDIDKIWWYFRNLGYSKEATAAAMGNLNAESGLISYRKQGDDGSQDYKLSKTYTENVDSGKLSSKTFINDSIGYGLAQWTYYTRKQSLYNYAKRKKTSIGDLQMQMEYLIKELSGHKNESWYKSWYNASSEDDIASATTLFCKGFEKPGVPHIDSRISSAKSIYKKYKDANAPSTSTVSGTTGGSNKIIPSAIKIKKYIAQNSYYYSQSGIVVPNYRTKTIDCSSYVSWVLCDAGYDNFCGYQQNDRTFYANSWKFPEVNKNNLQPGDILIYQGHVEIYAGYSNGILKVYNAGSTASIRIPGITSSGHTISQIVKILRVK